MVLITMDLQGDQVWSDMGLKLQYLYKYNKIKS